MIKEKDDSETHANRHECMSVHESLSRQGPAAISEIQTPK